MSDSDLAGATALATEWREAAERAALPKPNGMGGESPPDFMESIAYSLIALTVSAEADRALGIANHADLISDLAADAHALREAIDRLVSGVLTVTIVYEQGR